MLFLSFFCFWLAETRSFLFWSLAFLPIRPFFSSQSLLATSPNLPTNASPGAAFTWDSSNFWTQALLGRPVDIKLKILGTRKAESIINLLLDPGSTKVYLISFYPGLHLIAF
ncbi:hypothetical protein MLD38_009200 [Melastoma candidum]|uniref:Uncharacterized protein n=1 Tax=Melastoma candidum TaxID=119954 RepID=A0ACB9RYQ0_9MYRT|nr:hypothetical protein MLD38_009200 [Melastoma candidum]